MVILKHLSKPNKNGKKTDLSAFVQFMCLTKGNVDKLFFAGYQAIVGNSKVHTFLQNHPDYSTKLTKFLQQLQNETISEIAEKNLSVWIKELVEEQTWDTLMSETPLTLLNKLVKQFINEEFTF